MSRPRIDRCLISAGGPTPATRAPTSIREVSHERFKEWLLAWLAKSPGLGIDWPGLRLLYARSLVWPQLETSADEREALLEQLEAWGIAPRMLKE